MNIVGYKSPFKKSSPMKALPMAAALAISAAPGIIKGIGSLFGMSARRDEQNKANEAYRSAKSDFDAMMSREITNPFENLQNPYADLQNPYSGLQNPYAENIYEDLGVNMRSADYLRDQQRQSQANIMHQMRGVAGGSGVAGLAQAMANISDKQAREASARISEQEAANEKLRLQGADQRRKAEFSLDKLKRESAFDIDKLQRSTDFQIEQAKIQGEMMAQQQRDARTERLFGMAMDRKMAADQARADARAQQFSALGDIAASIGGQFMPGGQFFKGGSGSSNIRLGFPQSGLDKLNTFYSNPFNITFPSYQSNFQNVGLGFPKSGIGSGGGIGSSIGSSGFNR